eukprot:scaffold36275_cov154-Isochrysis_galbana.AAC.6
MRPSEVRLAQRRRRLLGDCAVGGARHLKVASAREDDVALDHVVGHQGEEWTAGGGGEGVLLGAVGCGEPRCDERMRRETPWVAAPCVDDPLERKQYALIEGRCLDDGVDDRARVAK